MILKMCKIKKKNKTNKEINFLNVININVMLIVQTKRKN